MNDKSQIIARWLYTCAGLVMVMIVVGAITRLTNSGLSMVEWRPLMGTLPPLNDAEWMRVFDLYKDSPQYQKVHFWMGMDDFKMIFFWEWFHRLLGRLIGLAYGLPLLFFWIKGWIPKGFHLKLFGMLVLGGLQGLMGWYMVKSGLVDHPEVSHYRLAAHLGLAFIILFFLTRLGLSLSPPAPRPHRGLLVHGWAALGILALTMIWGAYTAGLDAGLIYNDSFPKMGGQWVPHDALTHTPLWTAFFETHGGVQFVHRWLAIATLLTFAALWWRAYRAQHTYPAIHALGAMVLLQFTLGLATLFTHVALPIAVAHQAGAAILLIILSVNLKILQK